MTKPAKPSPDTHEEVEDAPRIVEATISLWETELTVEFTLNVADVGAFISALRD